MILPAQDFLNNSTMKMLSPPCWCLTALILDFYPFPFQSIVCVWDSGRRLVLAICKLMITFYWQWAPQKGFAGCKNQNNGGAPGGNLSKIFQVFVKNLGIIWPNWEGEKVDGYTTRLTLWCEPGCQKLKIHVSICWFVLRWMRSGQTRRGPRLKHAPLHFQTQLCCATETQV